MNRRRVTASDLAEMGFCEQKCRLKVELGPVDTDRSRAAKRDGTLEHQRFHDAVTRNHDRVVDGLGGGRDSTDRRCFIASAVYGPFDPRTDELRSFRDRVLLVRPAGRILVAIYYACSPAIAVHLQTAPRLTRFTRRILDLIRRRIAPHTRKEASHGKEHLDPPQDSGH